MPKITDTKKYWRETATKAGLDEDSIKQVESVFDKPEALKAFTDGFMPLPNYSHDLDDVRTKTKAEKDQEYKDWHAKELVKYNEYVGGLDRLKKYEETYGPLDVNAPPDTTDRTRGGKAMTQEEIDKLVETKLTAVLTHRDASYLEYMELREQHMSTFGKPLDRAAFEAAYKEHPEWGTLKAAYKFWTEPEMEKAKEAKWKADADKRYEDGVRDGYSRRAVPTDHAGKEFSPLFDRKADVAKLGENEQDQHSREAFFEGLREGNKQPA